MKSKSTVIIACDTRIYSEGISQQINLNPEFSVVAVALDSFTVLAQAKKLSPDILILDMSLDNADAIMDMMKAQYTNTRIVALVVTDKYQQLALCAKTHVAGIILKEDSLLDLDMCLTAVRLGQTYCSSDSTEQLMQLVAKPRADADYQQFLTRRQTKILQLMEMGHSNKKIANDLGIEVSTVKNHVHSILQKLNASTRGEAAAIYRRQHAAMPTTQAFAR